MVEGNSAEGSIIVGMRGSRSSGIQLNPCPSIICSEIGIIPTV